ncbi:MAG: hypothetical protein JSR98_22080 [Proteobacteria bacterium]|nr:hypothetical protein [Pseudomonadota bacterium]
MPPFLAQITISGDAKMSGVFEACLDPAEAGRSARERAEARPADAPPPLTGCASSAKVQPGGAIHHELSCDRAKGAAADVRFVSDGTLSDLHMHMVRTALDPATGALKTTAFDGRMVNEGPCPANLKPGEMRQPGGPVMDAEQAREILRLTRGQAE